MIFCDSLSLSNNAKTEPIIKLRQFIALKLKRISRENQNIEKIPPK